MRRVYVDLDDVLAQTGRMFLRVLAGRFGRTVPFDSIRSYHLGESLGLDPGQLDEFLRITHEPEPLLSIEPMPGAHRVLDRWIAAGRRVLVVTGRPASTLETTRRWLESYGVPFTELHLLDKYSSFYDGAHGSPDGVWTLEDLRRQSFDLGIEDFPGTARHLAEELQIPVALFDRPWNRGVAEASQNGRMVRCHSWREIGERFPI